MDAQADLSVGSDGTFSHIVIHIPFSLYHSLGLFNRCQINDIFFYFSQKTGSDISCKLSPVETICMKSHIQFLEKIRKIFQNVFC